MAIQDERFKDSVYFVNSLMRLIDDSSETLPPYSADTRRRDERLLQYSRSDTFLSSILSYAVAKQKAAPWLLTGSARQVGIYSRMLHNAHRKGWRTWLSMQATAYYSTNLGFISEIEFTNNIPSNIYAIDSTRVRLTNNLDKPAVYYPRSGKNIELNDYEILHANSMPSLEEKMTYAGFCATERAMNFVRMSIAINQNHLEKMGFAPPKSIMIGKGITKENWKAAIEGFEEDRKNKGSSTYEGVLTLLTGNSEADLKILPLSELPDQFDIVKYAEVLVNGICAAYGVPSFNVWAMSTGSFGRGAEAQVSNQEASRSGAMEFISAMQEELTRKILPPSVSFTFDLNGSAIRKIENANEGEMIKQLVSLYNARGAGTTPPKIDPRTGNSDSLDVPQMRAVDDNPTNTPDDDKPILTRSEIRQILAAENYIPHEWTDTEQDVTVTDIQVAREVALENPMLREAASFYRTQPIIQYLGNILPEDDSKYSYSRKNIMSLKEIMPPNGKTVVLWENGEEMLKRKYY